MEGLLSRAGSHPEKKGPGCVEVGLCFRVGKGPVAQPGIPMQENGVDPHPEAGEAGMESADLHAGGQGEAVRGKGRFGKRLGNPVFLAHCCPVIRKGIDIPGPVRGKVQFPVVFFPFFGPEHLKAGGLPEVVAPFPRSGCRQDETSQVPLQEKG